VVEELAPPKPYAKAKRKLQRIQRRLSASVKGSNRSKRKRLQLAKAHERIANIRGDFLHGFTSKLVNRFGVVVLEDLSVKGMAGGMLAGTIQDLGFAEFRRQVEYKAEAAGTKVVIADRFYPSSKTCSHCGAIREKLELSERVFHCECGFVAGRDENAAINLEKLGQSMPEVTRGETGGSPARKGRGARRGTANTVSPAKAGK
jgi:putative transposase